MGASWIHVVVMRNDVMMHEFSLRESFYCRKSCGRFFEEWKIENDRILYAYSFFMNLNATPEGTGNKSFLLCLIIVNGFDVCSS